MTLAGPSEDDEGSVVAQSMLYFDCAMHSIIKAVVNPWMKTNARCCQGPGVDGVAARDPSTARDPSQASNAWAEATDAERHNVPEGGHPDDGTTVVVFCAPVEVLMSDTRSAWIAVLGTVLAALIAGVFAIMISRPSPDNPAATTPVGPSITSSGVMGPLEVGINRQGMDMSDNGEPAENAETCSNLCRANDKCRAMTYVISRRTCWLKAGVPPPFPPGGPDYVSGQKQ
jgi:hypothetical protein